MPEPLADPAHLGALDPAGLAAALRPLWEDAGLLASRLAGRPFASWSELIDAAEAEIAAMSDAERSEMLNAHPRLGESSRTLRERSEASWREQGGPRLDRPTPARLRELNQAYEQTFGFPFVEWVAGRPLEDVIPVLECRMQRDRASELEAGCRALVAIARDRLSKILAV